MTISITEDILSITELKRNTTSILKKLHDTGRPVILTVNGKAEAVIIDAGEYEKNTHALNMLKMLVPAEEDVKEGRIRQADSFFKEFKRASYTREQPAWHVLSPSRLWQISSYI